MKVHLLTISILFMLLLSSCKDTFRKYELILEGGERKIVSCSYNETFRHDFYIEFRCYGHGADFYRVIGITNLGEEVK